jgi:hypothetical protein
VTSRELSAAVSAEIPFLGLAFASERQTTSARLDPPDPARALPPPSVRVETMELVGFGGGARRALTAAPGARGATRESGPRGGTAEPR